MLWSCSVWKSAIASKLAPTGLAVSRRVVSPRELGGSELARDGGDSGQRILADLTLREHARFYSGGREHYPGLRAFQSRSHCNPSLVSPRGRYSQPTQPV